MTETTETAGSRATSGRGPTADPPPVVLVGAGGYVGRRLTAALTRAGRTVLAASRSPLPENLSDGGPGPGRVLPVTYPEAAGLGDAVRAACDRDGLPLPGGAVASIGGWHLGARLLDQPDLDGWRDTLDSHLTAHLAAVRALAPLLRESAGASPAYVALNGAARAEPMAGSGAINVTGAGLAMLIQVLRLEEKQPAVPRPVRFHELVIDHAVAGDDRNVTPERTVPPARVAETLVTILDEPGTAGVVHVH
ncbi:SDR family oxidoreductase [Myceligenerans indicum]|uniref:SDR family oxidoreductase n=1 Tax=Myceligenerans indicum TaxID=2593663 RepID=A0ABS1LHH6_9MICO|nr:SDR family oxidoreductase [Myceligenerans indicum]MBL0885681.1 SDR family oxidoreductase [Myceligenerans indicum]